MKSLLLNTPNPTDGTSLYRGYGPLGHLKEALPDVKMMTSDAYNWAVFAMVDGLFMQRPYTDNHMQIAEMARASNVPIWMDYDDDLFRVPRSNPTFKVYSDENTKKRIAKLLAMASVVTVSTGQIKANFKGLNENILVIPNALDERTFNRRPEKMPLRNPMMLWRGSPTHDKDLAFYTEPMREVAREFPKFSWCFMGGAFWMTLEQMPPENLIIADAVDPIEYFDVILKIAPAAMIVPLHNSDFNRTKSNIAWIEATYAGAVCIAPDWEEWQKPGCLTYRSESEFKHICRNIIRGEIDIEAKVKQSWDFIKEHLTLKTVNQHRIDVIRGLLRI
jgi:hypothetical protein